MSIYWSDHVQGLAPYVAGEQPKQADLLKLNTNEHPFGPSPRALAAIQAAATDRLRLYPDNESSALREAVATSYGVRPEQVFPGNGSDEVLAHIFNALLRRPGKALLMPDITYSFYRTYCKLFDIPVHLVPLAEDFSIRPADYIALAASDCAGVIFANPNAPTGMALTLEEVAAIATAHQNVPVIVDEAYVDFGAESAVALLDAHPNIVVVHTLSKSRALAGLRVGYAIASEEIVQGLVRVKDSFNSYPLDMLAQAGAVAALTDVEYFDARRQEIMDAREELVRQLTELGFEVLPSQANFVFARHPQFDGQALHQGLRQRGVLVRHFRQPRIEHFLRITVGTRADNQRLCKCLADLLAVTH